ncbi:MAG: hypothetical protein CMM07_11225 [Rhodopirellula sp.]|nr:hypothetical protein [Rhodopirellula sp.]
MACKSETPCCPYRVQHRLYEVWQRSDPMLGLSEPVTESSPGSSPEQDSLTHNNAIQLVDIIVGKTTARSLLETTTAL